MSVGEALLGGPTEDEAWGLVNRPSVLDSINQFVLNACATLELASQSILWHFSICSSISLFAYLSLLAEGIEENLKNK